MYKKGVILFSLSLFLGFFLVSLFNSTSSVSNAENQVGENLKKKMPNLKRKTPKKSIILSYSESAEDSNVVVNVVRSEDEWQGMLASAFHPPCREDSDCGLAMACIDNICSACVEDGDCDIGESCVLEHCVKSDNVKCKSRKGCKKDALCVLSPYSDGVRGNEDMHSFCRANSGGTEQVEDPLERRKFDEARGPRQPSSVDLIKVSKDLKYEDETR